MDSTSSSSTFRGSGYTWVRTWHGQRYNDIHAPIPKGGRGAIGREEGRREVDVNQSTQDPHRNHTHTYPPHTLSIFLPVMATYSHLDTPMIGSCGRHWGTSIPRRDGRSLPVMNPATTILAHDSTPRLYSSNSHVANRYQTSLPRHRHDHRSRAHSQARPSPPTNLFDARRLLGVVERCASGGQLHKIAHRFDGLVPRQQERCLRGRILREKFRDNLFYLQNRKIHVSFGSPHKP